MKKKMTLRDIRIGIILFSRIEVIWGDLESEFSVLDNF